LARPAAAVNRRAAAASDAVELLGAAGLSRAEIEKLFAEGVVA
jgi:hypothetical protein